VSDVAEVGPVGAAGRRVRAVSHVDVALHPVALVVLRYEVVARLALGHLAVVLRQAAYTRAPSRSVQRPCQQCSRRKRVQQLKKKRKKSCSSDVKNVYSYSFRGHSITPVFNTQLAYLKSVPVSHQHQT